MCIQAANKELACATCNAQWYNSLWLVCPAQHVTEHIWTCTQKQCVAQTLRIGVLAVRLYTWRRHVHIQCTSWGERI